MRPCAQRGRDRRRIFSRGDTEARRKRKFFLPRAKQGTIRLTYHKDAGSKSATGRHDEIEISPAMTRAGVAALWDGGIAGCLELKSEQEVQAIAVSVFSAMNGASRRI